MQSVRRLSLHKHMKVDLRRKRYSISQPPPALSSILENQLFNTKAGMAYVVSLIGCVAYNYFALRSG